MTIALYIVAALIMAVGSFYFAWLRQEAKGLKRTPSHVRKPSVPRSHLRGDRVLRCEALELRSARRSDPTKR